MSYVDLFIIHWPGVKGKKADDERIRNIRTETWKALEDCYLINKNVKSIGVSNYTIKHLTELFEFARVKPHLLQSEHHPLCYQIELVDFCAKNDIIFQAYSSLGTSEKSNSINLLNNQLVNELALKYNRKSTQILLKWSVQQNIGVIPKSTNPLHIKSNIELFDFTIDQNDIKLLNEINKNLHLCWNPNLII
jgi:diketogulonate reductase-like aldo/keto reductase